MVPHVGPLDAELAEPVRETANPVRELTVSAVPRTVDQRGLIRRDSCSPLNGVSKDRQNRGIPDAVKALSLL